MYCPRCRIVLDISEQQIGYCRKCDIPRLLEEIRDQMRGTPGVNMIGRIFINGIEQVQSQPYYTSPIITKTVKILPSSLHRLNLSSPCVVPSPATDYYEAVAISIWPSRGFETNNQFYTSV
jgi:catechol-2,3-dioxygenase